MFTPVAFIKRSLLHGLIFVLFAIGQAPTSLAQSGSMAADSFAGAWKGTARDQYEDGSYSEYPITIQIRRSNRGYEARVEAELEATAESGQPLAIRYSGEYEGGTANRVLTMRSRWHRLHVVELDQDLSIGPYSLTLEHRGDRMQGRAGNENDGWTDLVVMRQSPQPRSSDRPFPGSGGPVSNPELPRAPRATGVPSPRIPQTQNRGEIRGPLHPLFASLPGANALEAPSWVRPGMRLTFWLGSASIVGASGKVTLVEDPKGDWTLEDGKKYRETSPGSGSGAAGYVQIDIVAVTRGAVVMDLRSYLGDGQISSPALSGMQGILSHPSGCEFWVHPQLLRQLRPGTTNGFQVGTGPYEVNGVRYNSVVIRPSAAGSSHSVYDLESGLLLSSGSSSASRTSHVEIDPATGLYQPGTSENSMMMVSRFVTARQTKLPWARESMPDGFANLRGFRLDGSYRMDMNLGTSLPGTRLSGQIEITRRDPFFLEYEFKTTGSFDDFGGSQTSSLVRYSAPAQVGGLWVAPQVLARLDTGRVLDEDPVTGYRILVEWAGRARDGRSVVVITEKGRAASQQWAYDRQTGLLVTSTHTQVLPDQTTITTEQRVVGQF